MKSTIQKSALQCSAEYNTEEYTRVSCRVQYRRVQLVKVKFTEGKVNLVKLLTKTKQKTDISANCLKYFKGNCKEFSTKM